MNLKMIPLSALPEGSGGVVEQIRLSGAMRRRMQDLGLVDGTPVTCCKRVPSGGPTAYWFRGTMVALRSEDACRIFLRPCSAP